MSGQPIYNSGRVPVASYVPEQPQQQYQQQYQQQQYQQQPPPQNYSQPPPQNYNQPRKQQYVMNASETYQQPQKAGGHTAMPYATDPTYEHPDNADASALSKIGSCRDAFWAALFIAHFILWLGIGFYYYNKYYSDINSNSTPAAVFSPISLTAGGWALIGIAGFTALCCAAAVMYGVRYHARKLIWCSLIFSVVTTIIMAVYLLSVGSIAAGVILLILGVLNAVWIYYVQHRIQLTAVMIETVAAVVADLPSLLAVPIAYSILNYIYLILATVIMTSLSQGFGEQQLNNNSRNACYLFLVLSLYWTCQVIANIVFVTTAGTVAAWYFLSPHAMPSNPVYGAHKRATVNSFGSICLGSLIVAIIQTMRFFVQQALRGENEVVQCVAMCAINCLDSLVEYFNKYAYTEIAIYGKPYVAAARDAWQLLKARGFDAVINDDLTGVVVFFVAVAGAAATAVVVAGFAKLVITDTASTWGSWAGVGAVVGAVMCFTVAHVVAGGVTTLFVCYAEDSDTLRQTKPAVHARLQQALEVAYGVKTQQSRDAV